MIFAERTAAEEAVTFREPRFVTRESGSSPRPTKPLKVPISFSGTPIVRDTVLDSLRPAAVTPEIVSGNVPTCVEHPARCPSEYVMPSGSPVTVTD